MLYESFVCVLYESFVFFVCACVLYEALCVFCMKLCVCCIKFSCVHVRICVLYSQKLDSLERPK